MNKFRSGLIAVSLPALALALSACVADPGGLASSEPVTLPAPAAPADPLLAGFIDPPKEARPRTWWHWMNGNISLDGIAKDLAWMDEVGLGGLQNFDVGLATPQIVDERLVYMTPKWQEAFRFAAAEADRRDLELTVAASPGWSETGGPWVRPEDGLKKLVWSETRVTGGRPVRIGLPSPPTITGPFQSLGAHDQLAAAEGREELQLPDHYRDVVVLAVPLEAAPMRTARISASGLGQVPAERLSGADLEHGLAVLRAADGGGEIVVDYGAPQTVRTATLMVHGAKFMFGPPSVKATLQSEGPGGAWSDVADLPITEVPTTIAFAPVIARRFRLALATQAGTSGNMGNPEPGIEPPAFGASFGGSTSGPFDVRQFRLSADPAVDNAEAKAGFAIERDYYGLENPADALAGIDPARVVDLTGRMRPDGTLDWTPPAGSWRILRMGWSLLGTTNHPAAPEATGLEVDKFDAGAVRRYMEHYLGLYADALGEPLAAQDKLDAILTDSIEVGAANWTPGMIDHFRRLRGYDPTPWLPALAGLVIRDRASSDAFLYDFRRTLADLVAEAHYATVAEVAHRHGLQVYGEALESGRPSLGDDLAMRSHADVPMAALWTFSPEAGPNRDYLMDMKGAASVAHLYGRRYVAAESLTSALAFWAHAPKHLKRAIDLEFVSGINRPVIHTSVHQPRDDRFPGLSLMIFGQFFNRHESWAPLARPWIDYVARTSYLLQQGRNVADIAYFYGEEGSPVPLFGATGMSDAPTAHAFDFVDAGSLANALRVEDGQLVSSGGARYRVLYLGGSSSRMTVATLRKLAELVTVGAVVVGSPPAQSPSLADDPAEFTRLIDQLWPGARGGAVGAGRTIVSRDVEAALSGLGTAPAFRFRGASAQARIPFVEREIDGGRLFYLVNQLDQPERIEARFRVAGKRPMLWRPGTGRVEPVSFRIEGEETLVPLELAPGDAVFVVFRDEATASSGTVTAPVLAAAATLDRGWNVAFQEGRGAPPGAQLDSLQLLSASADPGIRHFSGIASYTNTFAAPAGWSRGEPLWLDLGVDVHDVAEVLVNGTLVGGVWHAPWRIDVGPAVTPGSNSLEVRVANRWINRLIGDAQPGVREKITYTTFPPYRSDAPLRPSGLEGPVKLLIER